MKNFLLISFTVLTGLLVVVTARSVNSQPTAEKIRIILDTDANNELDDQHAIAYLLFSGNTFDVEGITVNTTNSGGDIFQHLAEARRVVKLTSLYEQIPVIRGADGSFTEISEHLNKEDFDGADAVNFIIEQAHVQDDRPLTLLPIGKLTNIALALKKDPSIQDKIRVVWLGSNYPERGEHNKENDPESLMYILDETDVEFEMVTVRYGKPSGTDAVKATIAEIRQKMPGLGPYVEQPVVGRHGGEFHTFGDYSISLFSHYPMDGDPPSRPLFDMAAVAILKNPEWAESAKIPAPDLGEDEWFERPDNPRKIMIWENFDREAIMNDFYETMENYTLVE